MSHSLPVHPSTGDPVARDLVTQGLVSATDGATIMITGLPYAGSGIIVALPEYGVVLSARHAFLRAAVRNWVDNVAPAVTGAHLRPRAFGVWHHEGRLYLDVVEIFPSDERHEALAAGHARGQVAIWDAGRRREIPTSDVILFDDKLDHCERCGAPVGHLDTTGLCAECGNHNDDRVIL